MFHILSSGFRIHRRHIAVYKAYAVLICTYLNGYDTGISNWQPLDILCEFHMPQNGNTSPATRGEGA